MSRPPQRPYSQQPHAKQGAQSVTVTANCFAIRTLPRKDYHQYAAFTPDDISPQKSQRVMHKLQNIVAPNIFSPRGLYDGKAILYVSHQLELPSGGSGSYIVSLSDRNNTLGTPGVYEVKLTKTIGQLIRTTDLDTLIHKRQATTETTTATNILQLLLRQMTNQQNTHNNRAFFSPAGKIQVGEGLELWRGYFQSVRPTIGRMLVNIDTTMTAVYMSDNLITVALNFLGSRNVRDLKLEDKDYAMLRLKKFLKKVLINVQTTGARTKTIRDLVAFGANYEFSKDDDGQMTTVRDYLYKTYNITLRHPETFGVVLTGRNAPFPQVVPAELCYVLPGQLYRKTLSPQVTSEAVKFSTMHPDERLKKITANGGVNMGSSALESPIASYANSEFIVDSGMQIDRSPVQIKGKILAPPSVVYGKENVAPSFGAWNLRNQTFHKPAPLMAWAMLNLVPSINDQQSTQFAEALARNCANLGMQVMKVAAVTRGHGQAVEKGLEEAAAAAVRNLGGDQRLQFVVVLFPNRGDDIRVRIKYWGDVLRGVRTQCLREDKLRTANDQYWANVALKINARLGGYNSLVKSPVMESLGQRPFMIMGADVGHPGPGVMRPSITSLVWSHDDKATQYAAFSGIQHPRVEIIDGLKDLVKKAINLFGLKNKAPPEKIIFYRDGVSDGEFEEVGQTEIAAIKSAFDELWTEKGIVDKVPKPKLTFIVVSKRHHIVFFPSPVDPSTRDKTGNCRAGFVTTEGLSNPTVLDFYLQSHAAVKGTSRSSHYIVLQDENYNKNVTEIQELSFSLCHVYSKATRSVSIPAPVYYADIVCSRGAFHYDPDSDLRYAPRDDSTVTGGTGPKKVIFDIKPWQKGYKAVHNDMARSMYFL